MSATDAPIAQVLERIDEWPTDFAAAGVVDASGAVHRRGDTNRVLGVASITKLASALAVLLAVEEGTVGLDDPLGPNGSTVRHLLSHASGLDVDTSSVITEPGRRRIYSNTGYDVLAGHVGSCAGMAFEQYLADGLLQPLGMGSSELRGSAAKDLHTNVEDLLLLAGEYRSPAVLHLSTIEDALSAQFGDLAGVLPGWGSHNPCPWGLGPELRGAKSPHWTGSTASAATFGHFGRSGTLLWVDPEVSLTCVALTDRVFGEWAVEAWPPFCDAVRRAFE